MKFDDDPRLVRLLLGFEDAPQGGTCAESLA
jgi:hypothetical protein